MASQSQPCGTPESVATEAPPSAAFTPGDWKVVQQIACTNPNMGAWGVEGLSNVANHCTLADAHLIAAAKDLYEALRLVRASTEWSCMEADTQEAVEAALAKTQPADAAKPSPPPTESDRSREAL